VENAEVEFDVLTEESGKLKAVNVTGPDGAVLKPPPKRAPKKVKAEVEESVVDAGNSRQGRANRRGGRGARRKKASQIEVIRPFHDVLASDVKQQIAAKGIDLLQKSTTDIAIGGARIKLGRGGYCGYCSSEAVIGEGTYTCDDQGILTFEWKNAIQFVDEQWKAADASKLLTTLSLMTGRWSLASMLPPICIYALY
jgi:hypothetical protein